MKANKASSTAGSSNNRLRIVRARVFEHLNAPIELSRFGYLQVWHLRTELDPAVIWLRQLIKRCSG
ncbi:hypothetical protein [Pelagibius sp. Alg239-R121]|uniref:hypothetical protein n=1 Tax=Pelagibius sp. Alg239-R121 TaxID=2993448 RepID=UPI0024A761AC|nr:hypothetical protein [Pelagibius sp. Alg239-R121]